jgi:glycosyltransferase involved in cell wall biosynthesis
MRTVIISSPLATQSGYGHHAREVISNFFNKKPEDWDIKLLSMPWGHTPFTYPIPMEWHQRIIPLPLKQAPDIWVQITVPNEFQSVGKFNIGVTAGTEGDICPKEWIDHINKMQITIVPSQFTKEVFERTAKQHNKTITTDIQVVSEYFDETTYDDKNVTTNVSVIDQQVKESFAFLSVGHWLQGKIGEDRKNISGVIHCFFNTFKNKKNKPALIIKTSGATYSVTDRMSIEKKINEIRNTFPKNTTLPSIYLLHGDLTNKEMNALYNHPKIKAMVSFTKAEGFGRPLLEFSSIGKPVISPHYSGQKDFLKQEFICALPGELTPIHASAKNDFLIEGAKWFSVDYGYASRMFIDTMKNYKKWLELAKRQRYFVRSNFTSTAISKQYDNIMKLITEKTNDIPQQVSLKLPKLKLSNSEEKSTPKIKLPKLQKV